jgi:hypothetical protein
MGNEMFSFKPVPKAQKKQLRIHSENDRTLGRVKSRDVTSNVELSLHKLAVNGGV